MASLSESNRQAIHEKVFGFLDMFPSDSLPDMLLEAMVLYEFYTQFNSIAPTLNRLIPELSDVNFCHGLFKKDQELLKLLRDILEHRDRLFELIEYKSIRLPGSTPETSPNPGIVGNEVEATLRAWDSPYIGRSADLLERAIHQMNSTRKVDHYYANYVTIVQSSGTGKSRTVDQVARRIFTIPLNLRPALDVTGFPKGDPDMANFMTPTNTETTSQLNARYYIFFRILFDEVRQILQGLDERDHPQALAAAFHQELTLILDEGDTRRAELYMSVKAKVLNTIHDRKINLNLKNRRELINDLRADAMKACDSLIKLICEKSKVPWNKRTLADRERRQPVRLMIYFDEAHSLTLVSPVQNGTEPQNTAYQLLCRVLNDFRACDLFAIFLSTNSRIFRFSPTRRLFSSARGQEKTPDGVKGVQAPFVELPFDQFDGTSLLKENFHKLTEVCLADFMVRFGRPLFLTRYMCGGDVIKEQIVKFARLKLAGMDPDTALDENGQLAVLGIRVGLDFVPAREEAKAIEDQLVEGHMRIAFSVPEHREYMRSGTPSEPILAEAAAQLMGASRMVAKGLPEVLLKLLRGGMIAKGERGEFVARYLLTRGHDVAIEQMFGSRPGNASWYTHGVPLRIFLEALVGEENARLVLDSRPDNQPDGPTLGDSRLGSALLNFTHWGKAEDNSAMSDEAAWIGLARSMAWQCFDEQKDVDLVTPLAFEDDKELGRYNVSAVFWQIKGRAKNQSVDIDAEKMGVFSSRPGDNLANTRPYLAIILDLGSKQARWAQVSSQPANKPSTPSEIQVLPGEGNPSQTTKTVRNHPRYAFTIAGCSNTVYPHIVQAEEKHIYADLLAPRTVLHEHPRQDVDFLSAVVATKAGWHRGEGTMSSYCGIDWAESSRLEGVDRVEELREGIQVHSFANEERQGWL